jgi:hypothetical protein
MRKLFNFIRVRVMQEIAVPFAIPYLGSIDVMGFVGYIGYSIPFIYKDLYIVVVGRYIY